MVRYDFKAIDPVLTPRELADYVLSRTQRKTPTIVRKQFPISRIRDFYIRKVKYTESTINDKLSLILRQFPRLDDIHPFFSDLINILYDRDHYKIALGQLNKCRHIARKLCTDHIQLIKYAETLRRCKTLKVACLGRMAKHLRKLSGLTYLEKVRQHLSRLPQIDPAGRTILLTGFPNVGKSSFVTNITRAKVAVEPYPFTTQSLYVGHFQYRNLQWQVIDTPGILDHSLDERNVIEMQSINALAHLHCIVLFLVDVSGTGGFSIQEQMALFRSISPLFRTKPVMIVPTKIDLRPWDALNDEEKALLSDVKFGPAHAPRVVPVVPMSNITKQGIGMVRDQAADILLQNRVEFKLARLGSQAPSGRPDAPTRGDDILRRLYVSRPPENSIKPAPQVVVPRSHVEMSEEERDRIKEERLLEIDHERAFGGMGGGYEMDQTKHYLLEDDEWNHDAIPEIMDGKNVLDFYDEGIDQKLATLREEERERLQEHVPIDWTAAEYRVDPAVETLFNEIEHEKAMFKFKHRTRSSRPHVPRKYLAPRLSEMTDGLERRGVGSDILDRAIESAVKRGRSQSRKARSRSRARGAAVDVQPNRSVSQIRNVENEATIEDRASRSVLGKRNRVVAALAGGAAPGARYGAVSLSRGRMGGVKDPQMQIRAKLLGFKRRRVAHEAGERFDSDKKFFDKKPKHLYSGKMGLKRDRR